MVKNTREKEGFNAEEIERLAIEAKRLAGKYNEEFCSFLAIQFKNYLKIYGKGGEVRSDVRR